MYENAWDFFMEVEMENLFYGISFGKSDDLSIEVMMAKNFKFPENFPMKQWNMWIDEGIVKIVPTKPSPKTFAL